MASPANINELTSLISVTEIISAIIAIAAVFISLYVVIRAARIVLQTIRSEGSGSTFIDTRTDLYWQNEFNKQSPENLELNGCRDWQDYRDLLR